MADMTGRFEWVGKLARAGLIGVIVLLSLGMIATIAAIVIQAGEAAPTWFDLVVGATAVVGQLVAMVLAFLLYGLMKVVLAGEYAARIAAGRLGRIETLVSGQEDAMHKLADLACLSDRAKSLVYREREIDAVRETVHHDMMKQDYETAGALIDSLDRELGCADEAGRLREALAASRKSTHEEKIDAAVKRVQDLLDSRDWARATREAQRIARVFQDDVRVASLPERIELARNKRKRDLLEAYAEVVRKKDIDRGIELLKALDQYLEPREAAALEESARSVFKAKLQNLGVHFALCVTDRKWSEALLVGREIVRDYPNTRMAHEVQDKMDLLEARAESEREANAAPQQ